MVIRKRDIGRPLSRAEAFKSVNDWINDANRKNTPLITITALEIERVRIWTVLWTIKRHDISVIFCSAFFSHEIA